MSVDPITKPFPIDIESYWNMSEAGKFDGHRVELVDGVIVEMSAYSPEHEWATMQIGRHFIQALPEQYRVGQAGGVVTAGDSWPEPDLYVRVTEELLGERGIPRHRRHEHALLVLEVSWSSRRWDLGRKRLLYARASIPEYWVLDLQRERLVVHRDPVDGDYATVTTHGRGEAVAPLELPVPPFDIADALFPD